MKKNINNRRYDTDTARLVAEWSDSRYSVTDFNYSEEELYCKKTGEYFLHGRGGARTRYARSVGQNVWSGGEDIIPLTQEEARQWAEECMDTEDYDAEFGTPPESDDDSLAVLSVCMPVAIADKIRAQAKAAGVSISELIRSKFTDLEA